VRDRLIESWNDTNQHYRETNPKRVYYMSMEFLMGRSLLNSLYNLDLKDTYTEALQQLGYDMEALREKERDAALGNGGLGRLAACFLDSMATLDLPAWGYGLRYQYGMFRQALSDGFQREQPDYWLNFGNPWEIERPNVYYPVKFYGHVSVTDAGGRQAFRWNAGEEVLAVAYDTPIPGWKTPNTNNLRLWSAKPAREFDLESFNTGDYVSAILSKQRAETISSVLYPDDRTYQGKELRLKQQFFMVSATLQDILRRFKDAHPGGAEELAARFPELVALQLNDTHPTIGVPELMRLLMDEHGLGWTAAWDVTQRVFSFTNHTVLPEALEKWPIELVEALLPRHMQIIYDINWRFLQELQAAFPGDVERMARMSIIEEGESKCVRMAHLALVASHTVNGVAAIHSELIKTTIFKDFYALWPGKFQNKTNGVTQRRWLAFCNPPLRALISGALATDAWIGEADLLTGLRPFADDAAFRAQWAGVKRAAKARLARVIFEQCGVAVSPDALFDVQVKRIHEYKRQLLNVLSIIHRYGQLKAMSPEQRKAAVPRVCIIGGKAAPGYDMAKRIIKLVSAVGDKVNTDPDVGDLLKLVFIPDYNVSLAEVIVPASELSQHISTAGTEASGTSNMKFVMNGGLIIGTMDGANVEIAEEIGAENMFIFGALADDVPRLRRERAAYRPDPRFFAACDAIRSGTFGWPDFFAPIVDSITGGDYYLLGVDFAAYLEAQDRVDATYRDAEKWTRMSILSAAGSGKFSSDRTIREYAKDIWKVVPARRPSPGVPGAKAAVAAPAPAAAAQLAAVTAKAEAVVAKAAAVAAEKADGDAGGGAKGKRGKAA
jgi:starch phosphorylase